MGFNFTNNFEREEYYKKVKSEVAKERRAEKAKRMALADKIVMAVVDRIAAAIIRPGPKPEERECYVMAQELRDFGPELKALVIDILKIEDTEE